MNIPVLETARLRLRGHRADDFPSCAAMWADPNVTKFISGRASTEQQTWIRLLSYVGHWELMGFGYWAIEERRSGDFVGEIGFADFKRGLASLGDYPEAGFALASRFHGQGYATEALRAALAWADVHLPSRKTTCLVTKSNAVSLHICRKAGYETIEETTYNELPVFLLCRGGL